MSDSIDRQAAIEAFGERPTVWTTDDEYSLGARNQYDTDRLAIETVPSAQPEQRWIPCSERLPEENQICIVTDETRQNTYEYRFCKQTYDEEQGWTYLKHRIIAWMPLPEPY